MPGQRGRYCICDVTCPEGAEEHGRRSKMQALKGEVGFYVHRVPSPLAAEAEWS